MASSELVGESASPRRPGLFETYVGMPEVMLTDLLDDPDKYQAGVSEILHLLIGDAKKLDSLSPGETELLDQAVLDYMKPKSKSPIPTPKVKVVDEDPAKYVTVDAEEEDDLKDLALTAKPFWWA
jgi:hypothetical protein